MQKLPCIASIAFRTVIAICAACLLIAPTGTAAGTAAKGAPPTLEELFTPPWPFGTGARSVSLSDDGRFMACGWNDAGNPCRDLWVLDRESGEWAQLTDFWGETEARRRREFTRELEQARKQWDKDHPAKEEAKDVDETQSQNEDLEGTESLESSGSGDGVHEEDARDVEEDEGVSEEVDEVTEEGSAPVGGKVKEEPEFDADKRIKEFEEDLEKQRLSFGGIGEIEFRRASHTLLYTYGGSVWGVDLDGDTAPVQLLRHEQSFGSLTRVKDSPDLLVSSESDAFLWHPDGRLRQLTFGGRGDYDNIAGMAVTADEHWLAAVRRDYTSVRKQKMPDLLGENPRYTEHNHVRPGDTPERVKLLLYDLSAEPPWPIEVELPEEPFFHVENLAWDPAGEARLLITTIDKDAQQYRAYIVTPIADAPADGEEYTLELLYEETDDAWINWGRTGVRWGYGGKLLLQSEQSGLAWLLELHEVVEEPSADAAGEVGTGEETDPEELTPKCKPSPLYVKDWEIISYYPIEHSPNALVEYYFPDTTSKALALLNIETCEFTSLTPEPGWRGLLTWTEDESLLAYSAGDERSMGEVRLLDLAAAVAGDGGPADWDLGTVRDRGDTSRFDAWAETWDVRYIDVPVQQFPEFEDIYRVGDLCEGRSIKVKLYLPEGWRKGRKYPLLVWAHGAGYAQDVMRNPGWYTMFNPWVVSERGWIAAEVDYRGSEGYGRDWRVDVTGRLGHPEVEDLVAAKRYLVDEYGADPERTALWGWSYGGFLTLMAQGLAPDEFQVGCAVAPVNRWENYFYWYSTARLGDPADHQKAYERSAAETYIENITGDLLIVHGLRDDNTLFQSVAQYIEQCHEENVDVTLLLFPGDAHGISNEFHYVDVFTGILDYIDAHWPER